MQDRLLQDGPLLRLGGAPRGQGDKLAHTIYAGMPNSIRPGKVFHRGARGKRKAHGANKENSEEE